MWGSGVCLWVCVRVCARGEGEGGSLRRRHFPPFLGLFLLIGGFLGVLLVAAVGGGVRRGALLAGEWPGGCVGNVVFRVLSS